jgi:hypothetical protein
MLLQFSTPENGFVVQVSLKLNRFSLCLYFQLPYEVRVTNIPTHLVCIDIPNDNIDDHILPPLT